jgi:ankyrin repeat protein
MLLSKSISFRSSSKAPEERKEDPFLVIKRGDVKEIRQQLINGTLNLHVTRWSGLSLLHRAAEMGHNDLCALLVKEGIDVNIRSARGWHTPLHCALANGYIDTATCLIELGANPWRKNKAGDDAFRHGGLHGHKKICDDFRVQVLRKAMQDDLQRNMAMIDAVDHQQQQHLQQQQQQQSSQHE